MLRSPVLRDPRRLCHRYYSVSQPATEYHQRHQCILDQIIYRYGKIHHRLRTSYAPIEPNLRYHWLSTWWLRVWVILLSFRRLSSCHLWSTFSESHVRRRSFVWRILAYSSNRTKRFIILAHPRTRDYTTHESIPSHLTMIAATWHLNVSFNVKTSLYTRSIDDTASWDRLSIERVYAHIWGGLLAWHGR
jgi:hypothetical protein